MLILHVFVKLYATLRKYAPIKTEIGEAFSLELTNGTLIELVKKLQIPKKQTRIVFINGKRETDLKTQLKEGDLIVIFPPIGGGG